MRNPPISEIRVWIFMSYKISFFTEKKNVMFYMIYNLTRDNLLKITFYAKTVRGVYIKLWQSACLENLTISQCLSYTLNRDIIFYSLDHRYLIVSCCNLYVINHGQRFCVISLLYYIHILV